MITKLEAIVLVEVLVKKTDPKGELLLMHDAIVEIETGWIFYFQSKEFVLTKDLNYFRGACPAFIVDKYHALIFPLVPMLTEDECLKIYLENRESVDNYIDALESYRS